MKTQVYGAVLAAAMIFSVGAIAQDQQQSAPADQQQKQGQGQWKGKHGMHKGMGKMDSQARLDHMSKMLSLTDDQKAKIKPILDNSQQEMKQLRSDTSIQPQDRRAKAEQIHKQTMDEVRAVLTPDQQKKLDEMQQKRMARRGGHGKGAKQGSQTTPQS